MKLALLILFWGFSGWIVCFFIRTDPPCPKLRICFTHFVTGVGGGLVYYYAFALKESFTGIDFLASSYAAFVASLFLAGLVWCPKLIARGKPEIDQKRK
jgi:hypothetical protein